MLHFSGNLFSCSPLAKEKYAPFLISNQHDCNFLSLSCIENLDYCDAAFCCILKVKNFSLSKLDNDRYHIASSNCHFIAHDNFSVISASETYMRTLTNSSYNHFNEGVYQIARFRALYLNMLVLHASAVVYNDEVLLFSGVSGAGKSTQARLWLENTDALVLNYDKPVVKLDEERVLVSGSPWGGKEDLAINEVRPAKALFFVHQAKENRLERLSSAKAYAQAHLNYFVYPLNEDIENRYNDAIIRLIRKIPVYDLYCTDTKEAVDIVKETLYPKEEGK